MKRQFFKTQLVVSGIVGGTLLAALTAVFFQAGFAKELPKQPSAEIISVAPLPGHWLKTAQENWYIPALVEEPEEIIVVQRDTDNDTALPDISGDPVERDVPREVLQMKTPGDVEELESPGETIKRDLTISPVAPVYSLERARSWLNRGLDSINVMYVWSDANQLKVISITSFNIVTRQAAIVVIPLETVINTAETGASQDKWVTVQDVYRERGREGVRDLLQEKLEIKIPSFVHVNQTALQKLSDIVGVLAVNGDEITMLEAFEQTAAGIRTDDRDVVRAVASRILRPQMLLEVPTLLWIFTHDIQTNFSTEQMIRIFNISRQMDLGNMCKTALPGFEWYNNDVKYVLVSEQTWKNIMYEITN